MLFTIYFLPPSVLFFYYLFALSLFPPLLSVSILLYTFFFFSLFFLLSTFLFPLQLLRSYGTSLCFFWYYDEITSPKLNMLMALTRAERGERGLLLDKLAGTARGAERGAVSSATTAGGGEAAEEGVCWPAGARAHGDSGLDRRLDLN